MTVHPNTPVLIGVGQCVDHWNGTDPAHAPSPQSLRANSAVRALANTGAAAAVTAAIDRIYVVRTNLDSLPAWPQPFGRCDNPPATLAHDIGAPNATGIYSVVGGDQPQTLVNEACEEIFNQNATCILLSGSEAIAAMKMALKKGHKLDWSASYEGTYEDRGLGSMLLSQYELTNGLGMPTQTYPAFEHALRARLGNTRDQHIEYMSELWSEFSKIAAQNNYAQYPTEHSAAFLANESPDNYAVADPYLKWHVAQDAVNQGAALILSSYSAAIAMGVDPAKYVYLHGYAQAGDKLTLERADLSRSIAMELALAHALKSAGKSAAQIQHFDLYSCFPCAVLLAAEALNLNWRKMPVTVTGGLPFFGGAGNNYSMHAIASMIEHCRAAPDDFGLVLANGGFLSKESVGIYSHKPVKNWQPVSSAGIQNKINASPSPILLEGPCTATIETYTVTYVKGITEMGYIIASNAQGRILARVKSGDPELLEWLGHNDPIGRSAEFINDKGRNFLISINR